MTIYQYLAMTFVSVQISDKFGGLNRNIFYNCIEMNTHCKAMGYHSISKMGNNVEGVPLSWLVENWDFEGFVISFMQYLIIFVLP